MRVRKLRKSARGRRGEADSCSFDTSTGETLADLVSGECRTVPE